MIKNDPSTWPYDSVQRFIAMWNADEPILEIRIIFNMGKDSIYSAAKKLRLKSRNITPFGQARPRKKAPPIEGEIPCLGCGRPFSSEGTHNRLCPSCITESRRSNTGYDEHRLVL